MKLKKVLIKILILLIEAKQKDRTLNTLVKDLKKTY